MWPKTNENLALVLASRHSQIVLKSLITFCPTNESDSTKDFKNNTGLPNPRPVLNLADYFLIVGGNGRILPVERYE